MSVFRVYSGAVDPLEEFRGTAIVGERFAQVFNATVAGSHNPQPKEFFENLIADAIGRGCRVTYNPTTNPDGAEFPVGFRPAGGGNRDFFYTEPGPPPAERMLRLVAEQDKTTDKKVSMAVPSRAVQFNDAYLSRAVGVFMNPRISTDDKQRFLLGLLLLKRCR